MIVHHRSCSESKFGIIESKNKKEEKVHLREKFTSDLKYKKKKSLKNVEIKYSYTNLKRR